MPNLNQHQFGKHAGAKVLDLTEARNKRVCPDCEGSGDDYDGYYACDGCGGDGTLQAYTERQKA